MVARNPDHLRELDQNTGDQRDVEAADGEDVQRAGTHERFRNLVGQRGLPPQRHGPLETQRFIVGLAVREGEPGPADEAFGPAWDSYRVAGSELPVRLPFGLQLEVDSLSTKVLVVVEEARGTRSRWWLEDAGDADALSGEEPSFQISPCRQHDVAGGRLFAIWESERRNGHDGHGAEDLLVILDEDPHRRGLGEDAFHGGDDGLAGGQEMAEIHGRQGPRGDGHRHRTGKERQEPGPTDPPGFDRQGADQHRQRGDCEQGQRNGDVIAEDDAGRIAQGHGDKRVFHAAAGKMPGL